MMYKIQHGLVDFFLTTYTMPARTTEHLAAGRKRHPYNQWFNPPGYKPDNEHSFFIVIIAPWNKLTAKTVNAPSTEAFKQ